MPGGRRHLRGRRRTEAAEEAAIDCLVDLGHIVGGATTTVPTWVIDGYATIFAELDEQLAATGVTVPDVVIIPMGVGAFAAAAARWYRGGVGPDGAGTDAVLIGVEPTTADCASWPTAAAGEMVEVPGPHPSIMAGLNCGRPSPVA